MHLPVPHVKTVDLGPSDAIAWSSCGKVVQQRTLACLPTEYDAERRPYVFDESFTRSLLQFRVKLITRKLGGSIDAFAVFEVKLMASCSWRRSIWIFVVECPGGC